VAAEGSALQKVRIDKRAPKTYERCTQTEIEGPTFQRRWPRY